MPLPKRERVLVGCDPEVFLEKDGTYFPAIGLIGGTKNHPKKCNIGAVQEDNVMAEFNIPPAKSEDQFDSYVETMLNEVRSIAAGKGYGIKVSPWAEFTPVQLNHPQALTMGCEPDYDAWALDQNVPPRASELGNIRVAAGHVHVGLPNPNQSPAFRTDFVRVLDLFLGVPSVLIDRDTVRRSYYGRAGAYRPKPYGIEYRVLSNFWITESKYRLWVYRQVQEAYASLNRLTETGVMNNIQCAIQQTINEHDTTKAQHLINKYHIKLPG